MNERIKSLEDRNSHGDGMLLFQSRLPNMKSVVCETLRCVQFPAALKQGSLKVQGSNGISIGLSSWCVCVQQIYL